MSHSRIAFDASDSDYSEDDQTISGGRRRDVYRGTPRSTRASLSSRSVSQRSATQTPSRSRVEISPQPGPSRRNTPAASKPKPKIRRKQMNPDHKFVKEVFKYATSKSFMIPRLPFSRLVREILYMHRGPADVHRMTSIALEALQEATEMYMTQFMEDSYRCTLHRKQVTLKPADMVMVRTLRGGQL